MSFDPTIPRDFTDAIAGEMRDQFTSLKDLIDIQAASLTSLTGRCDGFDASVASLDARVTALEPLTARVALLQSLILGGIPATLTVSGFGRVDVNGTYTRIADVNGAPAWELLGVVPRNRILWNNFYPNFWTVKQDGAYDLYKCLTYTGVYTATYGTAPGGTVV